MTALLHVLGFLTASALYVLLATMTLGERAEASGPRTERRSDLIPLATAGLGLVWSIGELVMYGPYATSTTPPAWVVLVAFAALSFLPAVVVHSALTGVSGSQRRRSAATLVACAYGVSIAATILNVASAFAARRIPSRGSFLVLSVGFAGVVVLLTIYSARQSAWRRTLPVAAVAAFAVMLAHLTDHPPGSDPWPVELVGHHGSLLLVLVILYQDYRFALADLFLKRALTLILLTCIAAALYSTIVAPFLLPRLNSAAGHSADPLAAAVLVGLWIGVALVYPLSRRAVARFIDRVVLRRPDTRTLVAGLTIELGSATTSDEVLDRSCQTIERALSAVASLHTDVDVHGGQGSASASQPLAVVAAGSRDATLRVPTFDLPSYRITIGGLSKGRRLLSDDVALLETIARLAGRRIDALRVARERYERDLREHEVRQLATEAELRALQAQLNPHFLFNALTTIGYLVREAPDRALDTILRLTDVLRAVLKRSEGRFTTLGEELEVVGAYLSIEQARFEDRLVITMDVNPQLAALRVPPLVLQPVVENAVKHGIAPARRGGCITITARIEEPVSASSTGELGRGATARHLRLTVTDTGQGADLAEIRGRRKGGIGLPNLERRLERYFGKAASLEIRSAVGIGTTVEIWLPILPPDASIGGATVSAGVVAGDGALATEVERVGAR